MTAEITISANAINHLLLRDRQPTLGFLRDAAPLFALRCGAGAGAFFFAAFLASFLGCKQRSAKSPSSTTQFCAGLTIAAPEEKAQARRGVYDNKLMRTLAMSVGGTRPSMLAASSGKKSFRENVDAGSEPTKYGA